MNAVPKERAVAPKIALALRAEIEDLYAEYVACLDERRFEAWPDMFVEDCVYKVQPRENFDAGLPLCTIALESRGMLRDRVYSVTQTLFHAPYATRHLISNFRFELFEGTSGAIRVKSNYAVLRTKVDAATDVYNVGRMIDVVVRDTDGVLRFREKHVVFDSENIPNSMIYPI